MSKTKSDYIEFYNIGCSMMIFSFGNELSTKDTILRNFLSKSISQLRTINILNTKGQLSDCFIIYRSMVDRLGHLYYLQRTQSFQDFEEWSFLRQIDKNNSSLSDTNFKDTLPKELFTPSQEEKERYKRLKQIGSKWNRPNIEEEFKKKETILSLQIRV